MTLLFEIAWILLIIALACDLERWIDDSMIWPELSQTVSAIAWQTIALPLGMVVTLMAFRGAPQDFLLSKSSDYEGAAAVTYSGALVASFVMNMLTMEFYRDNALMVTHHIVSMLAVAVVESFDMDWYGVYSMISLLLKAGSVAYNAYLLFPTKRSMLLAYAVLMTTSNAFALAISIWFVFNTATHAAAAWVVLAVTLGLGIGRQVFCINLYRTTPQVALPVVSRPRKGQC